MYPDDASGIWQCVTLIVTNPVAIEESFLEPKLDGLTFHLKVRNLLTKTVDALGSLPLCRISGIDQGWMRN
jgi:hypothetical protein